MLRSAAFLALLALPLTAASPQDTVEHARDGFTQQRILSIDVPPIPNAAFTANVVTESATIMPDGARRTIGNHRLIARDNAGRVFQERRFLMPGGATADTPLSMIQVDDPTLHERTLCNPFQKRCVVSRFDPPAAALTPVVQPKELKLPSGVTIQNEDLGRSTIEGVDCLGSREIRTLPGKLIGSDHDQPSISEFWFSPRLGINVLTKRFDPRVAVSQTFTVSHITQSEPDPHLFAIPAGYHVVRDNN